MPTYYVAPNGDDSKTGRSLDQPLATIGAAHDLVQPGDTIVLRGGTYDLPKNTTTILSKSGTEDAPIRLMAYQDEQPILDGSGWDRFEAPDSQNRTVLIAQTGGHWHVEGLEITGGPFLGYLADDVEGSVFKDLNVHSNDDTGFSLTGESADNLISGGDFHNNFDPLNDGQNADGIAIKFGSGEGNVVDGARLYNNSDDGIDLWDFAGSVTIRNTLAYGHGIDRWGHGPSFEGNGNGFKLSGGDAQPLTDLAHVVENNVAWGNTVRGFTSNGNVGEMVVTNNTAFDNGYTGFAFNEGNHLLRNNVSFGSNVPAVVAESVDDAVNSWSLDLEVGAEDFASLDPGALTGPRGPDGALPDSDFLELAPGSDLIDAGRDLGGDFEGDAPDLGAFEFGRSDNEPSSAGEVLRVFEFDSDGPSQRIRIENFDLNSSGREETFDVLQISVMGETYRVSTEDELLDLIRIAEAPAASGLGANVSNDTLYIGISGGSQAALEGIPSQLDQTALAAALAGEVFL